VKGEIVGLKPTGCIQLANKKKTLITRINVFNRYRDVLHADKACKVKMHLLLTLPFTLVVVIPVCGHFDCDVSSCLYGLECVNLME